VKLNDIKKCCVARKLFLILNAPNGSQWLSDGVNAWLVRGVRLVEDSIAELFDLSEKQLDKIIIDERNCQDARLDDRVRWNREQALTDVGAIWYRGELFRAVEGDFGMVFLPVSVLRPVDGDYCAFYARWDEGAEAPLMIAVYDGMGCSALVQPVRCEDAERLQAEAAKLAGRALYDERDGGLTPAEAAADAVAEQMEMAVDGAEVD